MHSRRWALRQRCHGPGNVAKHVVYRHSLSLGTIIHRVVMIDHWMGGWIWSRFQPGGTRRWQPWFPHNSSAQANSLFIFIRRPPAPPMHEAFKCRLFHWTMPCHGVQLFMFIPSQLSPVGLHVHKMKPRVNRIYFDPKQCSSTGVLVKRDISYRIPHIERTVARLLVLLLNQTPKLSSNLI